MTETTHKAPGRNDRCPCGSGKKYKQCCLAKDAEAERTARTEAAEAAQAEAPPEPEAEANADTTQRHTDHAKNVGQPWKRGQQQARGFQKRSGPRRRGGS